MKISLKVYNPSTDTWIEGVKFTGYRTGFCSLASKEGDQIYLIGGYDDSGQKRKVESLNLGNIHEPREQINRLIESRTLFRIQYLGPGLNLSQGSI